MDKRLLGEWKSHEDNITSMFNIHISSQGRCVRAGLMLASSLTGNSSTVLEDATTGGSRAHKWIHSLRHIKHYISQSPMNHASSLSTVRRLMLRFVTSTRSGVSSGKRSRPRLTKQRWK